MFFWNDSQKSHHEGIGRTRDISVNGMYVLTTSSPPLKSDIRLKAILPPIRGTVPALGMHLQGRVVRVEAACMGYSGKGFAVAGNRLVLRKGDD